MPDPQDTPSHDEPDDEDYAVVSVPLSWGTVSLACFALLLLIQLGGHRWLGLGLGVVALSTVPLSLSGLIAGAIGWKRGKSRKTARMGVFLNGIVLFCYFVVLPVTFFVLRWLR